MAIDQENIQGLILRGYNYPHAHHLLFHFPSAEAGRTLLKWARPLLAHGGSWPSGEKPEFLVNAGLTFEGLKALGLAKILTAIDSNLVIAPPFAIPPRKNPFPLEFIEPPSPRSLGDLEPPNDPSSWWNGRFRTEAIHASLHLFAQTEAAMSAIVEMVRNQAAEAGAEELIANADGSPLGGATLPGKKVHFGYVDGIAQPDIDWTSENPVSGKVGLRHFLLGYDTVEVPSKPSRTIVGDLFRDGCYAAFRWMSQDASGFEEYLDDHAHLVAADRSREEAREFLAAKLMGRWRSGAPLTLAPERHDDAADAQNFTYADDAAGRRCPFSSHIRTSHPRDQPLSPHVVGGVPRLLRRGSTYGPEWTAGADPDAERGLIGMFLCASLDRQFLQVIRWMNANNFSPVFDGEVQGRQDPLFGSPSMRRSPTFRVPTPNGDIEVPLPKPLVRSRGTVYLLLPSLTTLDRLCR